MCKPTHDDAVFVRGCPHCVGLDARTLGPYFSYRYFLLSGVRVGTLESVDIIFCTRMTRETGKKACTAVPGTTFYHKSFEEGFLDMTRANDTFRYRSTLYHYYGTTTGTMQHEQYRVPAENYQVWWEGAIAWVFVSG